jgi:hypothetical protein
LYCSPQRACCTGEATHSPATYFCCIYFLGQQQQQQQHAVVAALCCTGEHQQPTCVRTPLLPHPLSPSSAIAAAIWLAVDLQLLTWLASLACASYSYHSDTNNSYCSANCNWQGAAEPRASQLLHNLAVRGPLKSSGCGS